MAVAKIAEDLLKTAARWQDFVAKLNPQNYARLQEAGLVKPVEHYIDGINRGTANIARQHGFRIRDLYGTFPVQSARPKGHEYSSAATPPQDNTINVLLPKPLFFRKDSSTAMLRALLNRHEAYEVAALGRARKLENRSMDKYYERLLGNYEKRYPGVRKKIGDYAILNNLREDMKPYYAQKSTGVLTKNNTPKKHTGHLNMDVLLKERKLLDRSPVRNNGGLRFIEKLRRLTGETQYLDRAGKYDPIALERFSKANAKNVLKNHDEIEIGGKKIQSLKPFF